MENGGAIIQKRWIWLPSRILSCLNWPPALALSIAAGLKIDFQLEQNAAETLGSYLVGWTIPLEIALAMWLVSTMAPRSAKAAGITVFSVFSFVSGLQVLNGQASCECFGIFRSPPAFTLVLDILLVTLLVAWQPEKITRRHRVDVGVGTQFLLPLAIAIVFGYGIGDRLQEGIVQLRRPEIVVLRPEKWIGKPLPIHNDLSPHVDISSGRFSLLFYDSRCPTCRALLKSKITDESQRIIVVELPPFTDVSPEDSEKVQWVRLSARKHWFVALPQTLELEDGIVTAAK